jgi:hypothetical protein
LDDDDSLDDDKDSFEDDSSLEDEDTLTDDSLFDDDSLEDDCSSSVSSLASDGWFSNEDCSLDFSDSGFSDGNNFLQIILMLVITDKN